MSKPIIMVEAFRISALPGDETLLETIINFRTPSGNIIEKLQRTTVWPESIEDTKVRLGAEFPEAEIIEE